MTQESLAEDVVETTGMVESVQWGTSIERHILKMVLGGPSIEGAC